MTTTTTTTAAHTTTAHTPTAADHAAALAALAGELDALIAATVDAAAAAAAAGAGELTTAAGVHPGDVVRVVHPTRVATYMVERVCPSSMRGNRGDRTVWHDIAAAAEVDAPLLDASSTVEVLHRPAAPQWSALRAALAALMWARSAAGTTLPGSMLDDARSANEHAHTARDAAEVHPTDTTTAAARIAASAAAVAWGALAGEAGVRARVWEHRAGRTLGA